MQFINIIRIKWILRTNSAILQSLIYRRGEKFNFEFYNTTFS
jgi:hypothetical protein